MLTSILNTIFPNHKQSPIATANSSRISSAPCIGLVRGQVAAKQSLLIAASGSHNLLMIGPPGEGKSFLASTLPSFLPPLSSIESGELREAYRASNLPLPSSRPYRSIGPTITLASLLGGGRSLGSIYAGELALAHAGALFIDELPQFDRKLIDAMRSPLESGELVVSRGGAAITYPCRTLLLAAMNPCLCGNASVGRSSTSSTLGNDSCICSPESIARYQGKISGPILDRIDLFAVLHKLPSEERFLPAIENQSRQFLLRVLRSRIRQTNRNPGRILNSLLGPSELLNSPLSYFSRDGLDAINLIADRLGFSTRRFIRVARVSRTIADLMLCDLIGASHVTLAVSHSLCPLSITE